MIPRTRLNNDGQWHHRELIVAALLVAGWLYLILSLDIGDATVYSPSTDCAATAGQTISASKWNNCIASLTAGINSIDNDKVSAGAGIVGSKLELTSGTGRVVQSATATADAPILSASHTWNATGVDVTAWELNVTDTASGSGSKLLDLSVGGVSKFSVDKTGLLTTAVPIPGMVGNAINGFRLILSGATLTLAPVTGNQVNINGTVRTYTTLPTLAGGRTASTLYYIYLYDNSGTATLEASATSFTVGTSGRAEKTGDTTRRLMGMAYTDGSGNWQNSGTVIGVRSYNNALAQAASAPLTSNVNVVATSFAEVSATLRVPFVAFADDVVRIEATAQAVGGAGVGTRIALAVDGTTALDGGSGPITEAGGQNPVTVGSVTVGYHYSTVLARVTGGTGTVYGSATVGERTVNHVTIMSRQ